MASTEERARRNEVRLPRSGGGAQITGGGAPGATPSIPAPRAPQGLRLIDPRLIFSAVTAKAGVTAVWQAPAGLAPDEYLVQWATDAAFTTPVGRAAGRGQLSVGLDDLPVDTDIYVRVAGKANRVLGDWSQTATIRTPVDTLPPGPVTGASAGFAIDGTLEVRATPPASANFRTIRVEVWNGANVTQLDTSLFAGGVWTWSPTRNRAQTAAAGGFGATYSVTVRLYAVSWGNVDSTVVTLTAASAAPPTPSGLTHTWASDASGPTAGTAAAALRVTWTPVAGLTGRLAIDGSTAGRVGLATGSYEYPLAVNAAEHGGTPDPSLSLSLVFENGLGQVSATPATTTATNAAPPAAGATATGAFTTFVVSITRSPAQDLRDYRVRIYRDLALVQTFMTVELDPVIQAASGNGVYQADVTAFDVFGQAGAPSALTAPATLEDPAVFAAALRSGARYRDSLSTDPDVLKSALADGNRASGGISYS